MSDLHHSLRIVVSSLGCASLLALGCTDKPNARGQLMLAITSDMNVGVAFDRVEVVVERQGYDRPYDETIDLVPTTTQENGGKLMPGTYAIVAGNQEGESISVKLKAWRGSASRVIRELSTTIPRRRVGVVPMPIQWLCEGELDPTGDHSKCYINGRAETCVLGMCASSLVDESTVPDYLEKDVYGGYDSPAAAAEAGACFDVERCFDGGELVVPDVDCKFTRPIGMAPLNVGLLVKPDDKEGHCNAKTGQCIIPLDASQEFGWSEDGADGNTIALPPAACIRLADGRVRAIVATGACPTKHTSTPICGSWLAPEDCSNDRDKDGVVDCRDNCIDARNAGQEDVDGDRIGDACDFVPQSVADADMDGVSDSVDNCPNVANAEQTDANLDGTGDACDDDIDGDGIANALDNCKWLSNPKQIDCDSNGVGDDCDRCPGSIAITSTPVTSRIVANLSGVLTQLEIPSIELTTRTVLGGQSSSQTVPVVNSTFSSGLAILNAGQNDITATSCNCKSNTLSLTTWVAPADILVGLTHEPLEPVLDLYLYEPGMTSTACYFGGTGVGGSLTPLGGALDIFSADAGGAQIYTLSSVSGSRVAAGVYRVRVHYFKGEVPANFNVKVLLAENTADQTELNVPGLLTQSGKGAAENALPDATGADWVDVAEISCDGTPVRCSARAIGSGSTSD